MQRMAGERLLTLRTANNMSQTEAAAIVGVTHGAWSLWEKGKRMPDPYAMTQVAARFNVTLDFIYRGKLDGIHRDLALFLASRHPELVQRPHNGTGDYTDTTQP